MKIYMDVCCLCRPFDDQTVGRIRLEVTAVQEIIRRCASREYTLVTSEAITEELSKIPISGNGFAWRRLYPLQKNRYSLTRR